MSISGISAASTLGALTTTTALPRAPLTTAPQGTGFADRLGQALQGLASAQTEAADAARAFEMGKTSDLASVMISQQVSSLGFQLAVNVRNKALGAYRDIMNMPV